MNVFECVSVVGDVRCMRSLIAAIVGLIKRKTAHDGADEETFEDSREPAPDDLQDPDSPLDDAPNDSADGQSHLSPRKLVGWEYRLILCKVRHSLHICCALGHSSLLAYLLQELPTFTTSAFYMEHEVELKLLVDFPFAKYDVRWYAATYIFAFDHVEVLLVLLDNLEF